MTIRRRWRQVMDNPTCELSPTAKKVLWWFHEKHKRKRRRCYIPSAEFQAALDELQNAGVIECYFVVAPGGQINV